MMRYKYYTGSDRSEAVGLTGDKPILSSGKSNFAEQPLPLLQHDAGDAAAGAAGQCGQSGVRAVFGGVMVIGPAGGPGFRFRRPGDRSMGYEPDPA